MGYSVRDEQTFRADLSHNLLCHNVETDDPTRNLIRRCYAFFIDSQTCAVTNRFADVFPVDRSLRVDDNILASNYGESQVF